MNCKQARDGVSTLTKETVKRGPRCHLRTDKVRFQSRFQHWDGANEVRTRSAKWADSSEPPTIRRSERGSNVSEWLVQQTCVRWIRPHGNR